MADGVAAAAADSAEAGGAVVAAAWGDAVSEDLAARSGALPSPPHRTGSTSAERSAYAAAPHRAGASETDDVAAPSAVGAAGSGGGRPHGALSSARDLSSLPRSVRQPPTPPRGALVGTRAVAQKTVFMSDFCDPIELDTGAARLSDKQAAEVMARGFPTLASKAPADVVVFLAEVEGVVASSLEPEAYTQVALQQCGRFFLGSASLTQSSFALALSGQDSREIEFFPGMMLHQLLTLMQAYCISYAPPLADLVVHLAPLAPTHPRDRHRKDTRGLLVQVGAIVSRLHDYAARSSTAAAGVLLAEDLDAARIVAERILWPELSAYIRSNLRDISFDYIPLLDSNYTLPKGQIIPALGLLSFLASLASNDDAVVYVRQRDTVTLVNVREATRSSLTAHVFAFGTDASRRQTPPASYGDSSVIDVLRRAAAATGGAAASARLAPGDVGRAALELAPVAAPFQRAATPPAPRAPRERPMSEAGDRPLRVPHAPTPASSAAVVVSSRVCKQSLMFGGCNCAPRDHTLFHPDDQATAEWNAFCIAVGASHRRNVCAAFAWGGLGDAPSGCRGDCKLWHPDCTGLTLLEKFLVRRNLAKGAPNSGAGAGGNGSGGGDAGPGSGPRGNDGSGAPRGPPSGGPPGGGGAAAPAPAPRRGAPGGAPGGASAANVVMVAAAAPPVFATLGGALDVRTSADLHAPLLRKLAPTDGACVISVHVANTSATAALRPRQPPRLPHRL